MSELVPCRVARTSDTASRLDGIMSGQGFYGRGASHEDGPGLCAHLAQMLVRLGETGFPDSPYAATLRSRPKIWGQLSV